MRTPERVPNPQRGARPEFVRSFSERRSRGNKAQPVFENADLKFEN
jgi:hypothetical protein